jgi:hypothetical protein
MKIGFLFGLISVLLLAACTSDDVGESKSPNPSQTVAPNPAQPALSRQCSPQVQELPCADGAEVSEPYAFSLYTHCGVRWAYFDGRYWEAAPPLDDDSGNPPRSWGNPYDNGTMELVSESLARYTNGVGQTAEFKPLPVEVQDFPWRICA